LEEKNEIHTAQDKVPELTKRERSSIFVNIAPLLILGLLFSGFGGDFSENKSTVVASYFKEKQFGIDVEFHTSMANILSEEDLSSNIKDTVYTDKDCWLELRIDQQMLYQHWRSGKVEKYPVSTGNKYLSRSVESRPGLFAIFHKNAHHQSTQYNGADMYHFMPFNQGIGFHSMNGTGYYGSLGVAPSSHGCIRMRHNDVAKVFRECDLGTLVLSHSGYSARTVGFAPEGYSNDEEYSKEEIKEMLAENLYNILEGNYYITSRKFFVIDPKIIPISGIYISYNQRIPSKQKFPTTSYYIEQQIDRLTQIKILTGLLSADDFINTEFFTGIEIEEDESEEQFEEKPESKEMINKYFRNPIGILPYYGPND